jgi:glutamyl/glutaminyl-tRNA synthetase
MAANGYNTPSNFIQNMINEDFDTNRFGRRVHTRFPPEPNGYSTSGTPNRSA